jgi:predicted CoA-binding protein
MPKVAILGASADRATFGNKSVRAHLAQGYTVYPVNPKGGQVEGLFVYRSLVCSIVDLGMRPDEV